MRRLVELWSELELAQVLGFGVKQVVGLPRLLWGGRDGSGVFDVRPMADLVQREISWRAVTRTLRRGKLRALSVSCTEVSTGRTAVFIQTSPDTVIPSTSPPRTLYRADRIGPQHALASAAIPLLFPPARIDDELYLDGGLRQNTPISPALRLGATHVFAIGSSRDVRGIVASEGAAPRAQAPGVAFLLGKILNAFLLDHVDVDIDLLTRMNLVLADGQRAFGDEFVPRMSAEAHHRGSPAYRAIDCLTVRPSEDIGRLAAAHVRRGNFKGDAFLTQRLLKLLDFGRGDEADLASYLLFDGSFARELIEMGRSDAKARRDDLLAFFGDPSEQEPGDADSGSHWTPSEFPPGT
jgi:NTE family protein